VVSPSVARAVESDRATGRALRALPEEIAEQMFESAFELAPTGVALIGMDGRFRRVNRALCQMLGRTAAELVGSTSALFTHPDDLEATDSAFSHLREVGTTLAVEKRYVRPNGVVIWASTHGQTVMGEDGAPLYIVSHFVDVTAIKVAERRHQEASSLFEAAFADAPIGMGLFSPQGRWLKVNRALCDLTKYTEAQLLEMTFQDITHPEDLATDLEHMQRLLSGEADRYSLEQRFFAAQDQEIWVSLSVSIVRDEQGQPLHFIAHIEAISERKELQASLQRLAEHDPLTGLWNRRRFEEELGREAARCNRYGERSALLMIDLDKFKDVNDTYGHHAGDELLELVAGRIRGALRESDSVARIGGDEFAAILPNIAPSAVEHVAAKLRQVILASHITIDGTMIAVDASIGTQMLDQSAHDQHVAMARADAAMYEVKATR
jgi:diguanylate cyclase (GGDEF)-like protein/PAS domain S-box-containing protein